MLALSQRRFASSLKRTTLIRNFHRSSLNCMPEIAFKLADIGEGIAEVELLQWFVKPGDKISQFQNVCEVQSDKATVEITSRYDGIVKTVRYEVGQIAKVGSTLIDIEVSEEVAMSANASHAPAKKKPSIKVEPIKKAAPEPVSTPIPVSSVNSPVSSPLKQIVMTKGGKVFTSPSVRRLAKEHSIDLEDVPFNGDRLHKGDILNYIKALSEASASNQTVRSEEISSLQVVSSQPSIEVTDYLTESVQVPVTPIQKMMVKSMNAALKIPHFGYADEVEMDALDKLRHQLKPLAKERNIKVTYLPLLIKAASLSLKHYPILNASVSDCESFITMHAEHNISVAMDTPKGLIVPNIKNVQTKSVLDIAQELARLHSLATAGKLGPQDLTGGTFSLSNIGSIGGTYMSPVIMVPQVAIGAIGKIQTVPRFNKDGEVIPVKTMNVSWSGDHRMIDGATMARFSTAWKKYIENPIAMLTELR